MTIAAKTNVAGTGDAQRWAEDASESRLDPRPRASGAKPDHDRLLTCVHGNDRDCAGQILAGVPAQFAFVFEYKVDASRTMVVGWVVDARTGERLHVDDRTCEPCAVGELQTMMHALVPRLVSEMEGRKGTAALVVDSDPGVRSCRSTGSRRPHPTHPYCCRATTRSAWLIPVTPKQSSA